MSYGPALTGASPNQRTWSLSLSKKFDTNGADFSYQNFRFDLPELTTLTEPHVERAFITIENMAMIHVNSFHNNDNIVLMCDAADTGFNYGQTVLDNAVVRNNQAVASLHVASTRVWENFNPVTFVARWPLETIAFQLANPYTSGLIFAEAGQPPSMHLTLKIEIIEPLKNVTNEVVQTADYSGIKRARIAPLPPV